MMMSQNYAPYVAGYPSIDAVRTDLNRLFYGEYQQPAAGNLPISGAPIWQSIPGYQPIYANQAYMYGQHAYSPIHGYSPIGHYQPWSAYSQQLGGIGGYQGYSLPTYAPGHSEISWADPRQADPRYGMDPRFADPRFVDPRYSMDPRILDPRYLDARYIEQLRWGIQPSSAHLYSSLAPTVNVAETPDANLIVVELPGVDVRDISLQCAGNQLVLTAFRKPIWNNGTVTVGYQATEGRFGTLRRVFHLPAGYPTSQIQASFVNGQVTVVLPKAGVPMGAAMPTANIAINAAIPTV